MDIKALKSLTKLETSGVKFLKNQELTLCLEKKYDKSVEFGVTKVLASKYLEFDPRYYIIQFSRPAYHDFFL